MNIDLITRVKMKLSIELNGILVPLSSVVGNLQRFCRPLTFHNQCSDHDLSFSGSCLLVRHHGRNLLLCSRHQLTNAKRRPDEIVIVVDGEAGRRVGLNPNEVIQAVMDPSSDPALADLADIMLAEYSVKQPGRNLAQHFLSLDMAATPDLPAVRPEMIDAIFTIGYPTGDTSYDSNFDEEWNVTGVDIVSRWRTLSFRQAPATPWDTSGLIPLETAKDDDAPLVDPDGISGAPIFFIYGIKARKPRLGFAGIIIRANKQGRVNILEAAKIRQVLELYIYGSR